MIISVVASKWLIILCSPVAGVSIVRAYMWDNDSIRERNLAVLLAFVYHLHVVAQHSLSSTSSNKPSGQTSAHFLAFNVLEQVWVPYLDCIFKVRSN